MKTDDTLMGSYKAIFFMQNVTIYIKTYIFIASYYNNIVDNLALKEW